MMHYDIWQILDIRRSCVYNIYTEKNKVSLIFLREHIINIPDVYSIGSCEASSAEFEKMASCFQSFLILALVSLFAVSFSKLFEYDYTNSRFNSLSNESPTIQLIFGSPCTNRTGSIKKFNSDVWIINNTLIECSNNRSRNPVSYSL